MKTNLLIFVAVFMIAGAASVYAQDSTQIESDENRLEIRGELLTDERVLFENPNNWAWNENRLTLKLNKKIATRSKFHSEVWIRNLGLPLAASSADLYNKAILDPYDFEVREAYVQLYGFLSPDIDLTIGRQRIAWGTADKFNPTDNLNPYDLEDILEFGRHRGSDAVVLNWYFSPDFSLQGVFIPVFQPANLPIGVFANVLTPQMNLSTGLTIKTMSDQLDMPSLNLREHATAGLKCKGRIGAVDFSASYVWGFSGLPLVTRNVFTPIYTLDGLHLHSTLRFERTHIVGADFAANLAGIGLWAEAALFVPRHDVVQLNDISALPGAPVAVLPDTLLSADEPYLRAVVGADYHFGAGIYLNMQYLHGYIHEAGRDALNDYFFIRCEKSMFRDKLTLAPLSGAVFVSEWSNLADNYAFAYMPEIVFQATDDAQISLAAALINGKGDNLLANLEALDMLMLKIRYSF